ncbi:hypothetical protein ACK2M7_01725 [Chryseobacterium sp. TY4]
MNNLDINVEKEKFLRWQFWILTVSASFSRANIYVPEVDQESKEEFKKHLFNSLEKLSEHYQYPVSEERHIQIISDYIHESTKYSNILQGEMLRYGVAQKMVNLYFKYLWCAGYIPNPPRHFPLDRLIQNGTKIISWTKLHEDDDFRYLEKLNELCSEDNKAEWELLEYNKQFYN